MPVCGRAVGISFTSGPMLYCIPGDSVVLMPFAEDQSRGDIGKRLASPSDAGMRQSMLYCIPGDSVVLMPFAEDHSRGDIGKRLASPSDAGMRQSILYCIPGDSVVSCRLLRKVSPLQTCVLLDR
ncbi:hypothetical protein J6590_091884 [Homalodisca vitripennis]|nr:hypothetical protein J6590_008877 [Homalodisca vitripennis]KAG8265581.1 hypothetical protein J6590_091884 [Homalodisca vitripennis]